jgi:hypothetical protein
MRLGQIFCGDALKLIPTLADLHSNLLVPVVGDSRRSYVTNSLRSNRSDKLDGISVTNHFFFGDRFFVVGRFFCPMSERLGQRIEGGSSAMLWMAYAAAVAMNSSLESNQSAYFFTARSRSFSNSFGSRTEMAIKSVAEDLSGWITPRQDALLNFEDFIADFMADFIALLLNFCSSVLAIAVCESLKIVRVQAVLTNQRQDQLHILPRPLQCPCFDRSRHFLIDRELDLLAEFVVGRASFTVFPQGIEFDGEMIDHPIHDCLSLFVGHVAPESASAI